ncbi:hypothetical protein C2G38_2170568 [Gigaspora rosea]|uniref:BTB domain-containing protein n=1 Tax=Gigaspora rosea TaxID=44941 RepID=A0A397VPG8_9GLOM|nr:hypothetical protein C2G38_2170568 [Gigaspora rosea]
MSLLIFEILQKEVTVSNVSIQHFELIIKYICGGPILLEILDEPFIFELMLITHIFFLEELVKHFEAYLLKKTSIVPFKYFMFQVFNTKGLVSLVGHNDLKITEVEIDWKAKSYSVAKNPYSFNLLYRGSRDGFTSKAFLELCDREKDLIVVVKIEDTDENLADIIL